MDDQTFRDRLADELLAEKPVEATYKGWFRKVAIGTDIPQDSLRGYAEGVQKCPGDRLLKFFDYFGPAFEARLRGRKPEGGDPIAQAEAVLEHLKSQQTPQDIADRFARRVGTK